MFDNFIKFILIPKFLNSFHVIEESYSKSMSLKVSEDLQKLKLDEEAISELQKNLSIIEKSIKRKQKELDSKKNE